MFIVYILLDIPRRHDIQEARLLPQETKSQNSFKKNISSLHLKSFQVWIFGVIFFKNPIHKSNDDVSFKNLEFVLCNENKQ